MGWNKRYGNTARRRQRRAGRGYGLITLTVVDDPIALQSVRETLLRLDPAGNHRAACTGDEALRLFGQTPPDAVFLEIETPDMNGLETAERMKALRPRTNVVFITGYAEYALPAFELYASGFLLKPVTEARLGKALDNLRYPVCGPDPKGERRLKVRCFGQFEVWCDGKPVAFRRNKTKELFAYMIDRNGALCSTRQLISMLWPQAPGDTSHASQLRVFVADLQTTLTKLGFGAALVRRRGLLGIETSLLDCDYYQYLAGSPEGKRLFRGEYMSQYSFGETTLAGLTFETD